MKGDDIKIQTANGSIVTLTGTASEWSHRSLAEETVAELPGVKSVNDKLEIKGEQPAENSDIWIGMKVKTMLMFHRNVSGLAKNAAEKDLVSKLVNDIEGVKVLKNEMTIG